MAGKAQTSERKLSILKRRLNDPTPVPKKDPGTGGIELDAEDEKILDKAWAKEGRRLSLAPKIKQSKIK